MVSQSFQFECDAAQHAGTMRYLTSRQCLEQLAVRGSMSDRRVTRYSFERMDRAFIRTADKCSFSTTMLIAERNLKMKNLFAVALKAKVAWFDNSGVNRANSHLVDFVTFDTIEIHDTDHRCFAGLSAPCIMARPI